MTPGTRVSPHTEVGGGRELDARVAKDVFGATEDGVPDGWPRVTDDDGCSWPALPPFSAKISAAWRIVEKMAESGWHLSLEVLAADAHDCDDVSVATFWRGQHFDTASDSATEHADAAPLAICLAALRALATPPASEGSPE